MAAHNDFGRGAEDLAVRLLEAQGWRILDRNWRWRRREIDIVADRRGVVAFVEVRARRATGYGHPLQTIDWRKRRWLEQAAHMWIAQNGRRARHYRFDAIAVHAPAGDLARARTEHIENAWMIGE